jgi:hypothetical protein
LRQGKEASTLLLERILGTCFLSQDLTTYGLNLISPTEGAQQNFLRTCTYQLTLLSDPYSPISIKRALKGRGFIRADKCQQNMQGFSP